MFKRSVLAALILLAAGLMAAHSPVGAGRAGQQAPVAAEAAASPQPEVTPTPSPEITPEPTPRRIELIAACEGGEEDTEALWLGCLQQEAKSLSDGLMTVDFHPSGALGSNATIINRAAEGEIDLAAMPIEALLETVPNLSVLQTPLLFNGMPDETVFTVLNGENETTQTLKKAFADRGLTLLALLPTERLYTAVWGGAVDFTQNAKSLRVAIAKDAVTQSYWRGLGAQVVRYREGEAQPLLTQGKADALEGTLRELADAGITGSGYTLVPTDHGMRFTALFICARTYEMLPEAFRSALTEAVSCSLQELFSKVTERSEAALLSLTATGIQSYTGAVPGAESFEDPAKTLRLLLEAEAGAAADTP